MVAYFLKRGKKSNKCKHHFFSYSMGGGNKRNGALAESPAHFFTGCIKTWLAKVSFSRRVSLCCRQAQQLMAFNPQEEAGHIAWTFLNLNFMRVMQTYKRWPFSTPTFLLFHMFELTRVNFTSPLHRLHRWKFFSRDMMPFEK